MDKDHKLIWEAYLYEGITPEPPGRWRVKPEMEEVLSKLYSEIYLINNNKYLKSKYVFHKRLIRV